MNETLQKAEAQASALVFEKLVWTVEDVTKALGCSERHVRKLISEDRIPHTKVGRLIRFHRERVLEWLLKGGTR